MATSLKISTHTCFSLRNPGPKCVIWSADILCYYIWQTTIFLYQKPMRCTISHLYFGKELYMFQTDLMSVIRSLNTVFTATGIAVNTVLRLLMMDSKSVW